VEGDQGAESQAAVRDRHERWGTIRHCRYLENWKDLASGEWIRTFAIITTDANELVADIHHRMPVILSRYDYVRWLGEEPDPRD
jgi:putative SOS response-associated peptidase YedK